MGTIPGLTGHSYRDQIKVRNWMHQANALDKIRDLHKKIGSLEKDTISSELDEIFKEVDELITT
jgi:hypothetical protein